MKCGRKGVGINAMGRMGVGMQGIRVGMREILGIKVEMEVEMWGIIVRM